MSRLGAEAPINGARRSLGAMPALAVAAAAGLLLIALGNDAAQEGNRELQALFWTGLLLIYGPITLRLLSTSASREERIALVLTLGASLFLVKVLRSPLDFVRYDELGWWRATHDVIKTGHAFGDNPIVVSTPGFPGLSIVTAAVSQLTGLSVFHSGLVIIAVARMTFMLGLFLFLERVIGSARAAGVGIVIYACNPSFLYFDAQFGYESLAVMFGIALLLATLRWSNRAERVPPGVFALLVLLSCMLTVTHHMSALALLAFLVLWSAISMTRASRVDGPRGGWFEGPALPAAMLALAIALWLAFVAGGVTVEELGGVFSHAFHSVVDLAFGTGEPKELFSGASQKEHFVARALALASVIPLLVVIVLGLLKMRRDQDRDPLHMALAAVAVLYPVTLGLRLTAASSETSQRASEFVFVGVAFLTAMLIVGWDWPRRIGTALAGSLTIAVVASITFLGGFILGELQATRQPGPYLVGAEDRSITSEGIAAARFAARHLPEESRTLADRTNATLLASYGDLNPIFGKYAEISIPRVLFSRRFDEPDRRVIHGQSLEYVVVDTRLAREVPLIGYYVESDEPGAFSRTQPLALGSLLKFESTPNVSKVYTNGPISIYDTSALLK